MLCRLKSLKFVELSGFRGGTVDVELAAYLITNAPALEKITIDTRDPFYWGTPLDVLEKEDGTTKECANLLLTELLPPEAELLILRGGWPWFIDIVEIFKHGRALMSLGPMSNLKETVTNSNSSGLMIFYIRVILRRLTQTSDTQINQVLLI